MCGFFAWGGEGAVVAEFLLDPPTHKKSETGNRRTLDTLRLRLTPDAYAGALRLTLTPGGERLTLTPYAWR